MLDATSLAHDFITNKPVATLPPNRRVSLPTWMADMDFHEKPTKIFMKNLNAYFVANLGTF